MASNRNEVKVQVKLSSNRTVTFPVPSATTVHRLCEKVAEEEKSPAEIIILKFAEKVMKRGKTIDYYGVRPEMVLKVKLLTKTALQIKAHLPEDEVVSLEIFNTSNTRVIQEKLVAAKPDLRSKLLSFHIGEMKLNFENYAYEDCLKDGEDVIVKVKDVGGAEEEEEEEEITEHDRQEVLNSFGSSMTSERKIDIVFSFDTTGSMYSLLERIKTHLKDGAARLMADIPNIHIGIIAHGNYCDQTPYYVLRKHDLTAEVNDLVEFVNSTGSSGGDGGACYEWVMRQANGLSWREGSAKALVIIGDVTPNPRSFTTLKIDWRKELKKLCEKGVKIYGVQAYNNERYGLFYSHIASMSGGAHIKFQHFSLIIDMFFAVCYREAGDDQLQAYVDQVADEGRMTDEMKMVMQQLEQKPEEEKEEEKEEVMNEGAAGAAGAEASPARPEEPTELQYVGEPWWDPKLDTGKACFKYNKMTKLWSEKSELCSVM